MKPPRIQKSDFGHIVINNRSYTDNNIVLFWDDVYPVEKSHEINADDIEKLLLRDPEIIILGIGFNNAVRVLDDAKKLADNNKVDIYILSTGDALKKFKEFVYEGKKVAAIIHPTC